MFQVRHVAGAKPVIGTIYDIFVTYVLRSLSHLTLVNYLTLKLSHIEPWIREERAFFLQDPCAAIRLYYTTVSAACVSHTHNQEGRRREACRYRNAYSPGSSKGHDVFCSEPTCPLLRIYCLPQSRWPGRVPPDTVFKGQEQLDATQRARRGGRDAV